MRRALVANCWSLAVQYFSSHQEYNIKCQPILGRSVTVTLYIVEVNGKLQGNDGPTLSK